MADAIRGRYSGKVYVPPPPTDPPLPVPPAATGLASLSPTCVVVIRLERLGDVLLTTPTLRALRARYPTARIAVVTGPAARQLLVDNACVDTLIVDDGAVGTARALRRLGASLAIDLQRSTRSSALLRASGARVRLGRPAGKWHDRALTHPIPPQRAYSAHYQASVLRALGVREVDLDLDLPIPASVRSAAADAAEAVAPGRRIGLAPGAMAITRKWPTARWIALARALRADGAAPVVLWGPAEADEARQIAHEGGAVLAPRTTLVEQAAWIATCDALVTSCSVTRHLAAATRTPSVTLHGASSIGGWTRPTPWHRAVWTELECRPCHQTRCDIGVRCLADVTPAQIRARLADVLALGPEPAGLTVPIAL